MNSRKEEVQKAPRHSRFAAKSIVTALRKVMYPWPRPAPPAKPRAQESTSREGLRFETLEPRVLMSAELDPAAQSATALDPAGISLVVLATLPEAPRIDLETAMPLNTLSSDNSGDPAQPALLFLEGLGTDTPAGQFLADGSLISQRTQTGLLEAAGPDGSLSLTIEAGQRLSIALIPQDDSLSQGQIEVLDGDGISLATATALNGGASAYLQNLEITGSGDYELRFRIIDGAGVFLADVFLNAQIDPLEAGNQYRDAALSIEGSALVLPNGADRLGVVGHSGGLDPLGEAGLSVPDYYAFTLEAGQVADLAVAGSGTQFRLELRDGADNLMALAEAGSGSVDARIHQVVAPDTGTYYVRLATTPDSDYSVVVTRGATFDRNAVGDSIALTGRALGSLGTTDAPISGSQVFMPTNLYNPANLGGGYGSFRWDINGDGSIDDGSSDAYDGGLVLDRFPYLSQGTAEEAGREIALGPVDIDGLSVARKIYVSPDENFARFLEVVTNPAAETRSFTVAINTNLGSDGGTSVIATSSGDTAFGDDDSWIVTDDYDGGGDPTLAHVIAGASGRVSPVRVSRSRDNLSYSYDLLLQPGETQIVMHFASQNVNQASALSRATQLYDLGLNALAGMSGGERAAVVNFDLPHAADVDSYTVQVQAGDLLTLSTATPGDAEGEPENQCC